MSRLVVVSNRVAPIEEGKPTSGGLVVGVLDALRESGGVWFGWDGKVLKRRSPKVSVQHAQGLTYVTLGISERDFKHYYNGYSNRTLWPLFHSRVDLMEFEREDLAGYRQVNAYFASKLQANLQPGDLIWVHDYHLIPMGAEIRSRNPDHRLGFFLHTPFPPYDILRMLPGHMELIRSLCAYDIVGFHTEGYLTAFQDAVVRGAGGKVLPGRRLSAFGRTLRADVFPIGVDTENIAALAPTAVDTGPVKRLRESIFQRQLMIGVDRVDYSKGLVHRFEAYARFLELYPEHHGRITYLQIAPTSRSDVAEYRDLRRRLGTIAGDIVGRFSELDWTPIRYLNQSFTRPSLLGFFRLSRVGIVTPLCDGMNLVAMEYVAAQNPEDPGVLVLSQFAGAAQELESAVIVNPHDRDEVAEALERALKMPLAERRERWNAMMEVLRAKDVFAWRRSFVDALEAAPN